MRRWPPATVPNHLRDPGGIRTRTVGRRTDVEGRPWSAARCTRNRGGTACAGEREASGRDPPTLLRAVRGRTRPEPESTGPAPVLQLVERPVARAAEDHLAERFVAAPGRDGVLAQGLDVA